MRKSTWAGLSVLIALSTTACSLVGGETADEPSAPPPVASASASTPPSAPSSTPDPATPGAATPSSSTPAGPTPADPDQPASADQLGQPVATRESAKSGNKVTMVLFPVLRDGAVSHVNFTLSSPGKGVDRVQVAQLLSDGNYEAVDFEGGAADGLQLVDGKNSKLYLVASDGQGQCLCSRDLGGVFLGQSAPVLFSATFAAPPADVTAIDVRVPNFGTVKSVPVQ